VRLRGAEGVVVPALLAYAVGEFGDEFFSQAWDEFFLWESVPEQIADSRRLNIRLSSKDLEAIQKRELAEGLPVLAERGLSIAGVPGPLTLAAARGFPLAALDRTQQLLLVGIKLHRRTPHRCTASSPFGWG
jgi:hypothetical protein